MVEGQNNGKKICCCCHQLRECMYVCVCLLYPKLKVTFCHFLLAKSKKPSFSGNA